MRLVDGVLEQEGRVEVCVSGVWGSICGTGWNGVDGYVLCKQAEFDDAGLFFQTYYWHHNLKLICSNKVNISLFFHLFVNC